MTESGEPQLVDDADESLPTVSVVVPAYNEAMILMDSLTRLHDYLDTISDRYIWELVVVNDGSTDETGDIANAFAARHPNVRVLHHRVNFNLGQALRFAFNNCNTDYVVTIDCDLSYSPDHIERLLAALSDGHAKIALASPYMRGGSTVGIPWHRRILSKTANQFLSTLSGGSVSTLTGMVRAYDRPFLQSLDLKAMGVDINAEIVYKAQVLGARVAEVPAHLDWASVNERAPGRQSKMQLRKGTASYLFSGFMFRPVLFFLIPGLLLLAVSLYQLGWIAINTLDTWNGLGVGPSTFSEAVADTYSERPHAFVVGGVTLLLSIQLMSIGVLASQSKRYFEELFHLATTIYRDPRDDSRRS